MHRLAPILAPILLSLVAGSATGVGGFLAVSLGEISPRRMGFMGLLVGMVLGMVLGLVLHI